MQFEGTAPEARRTSRVYLVSALAIAGAGCNGSARSNTALGYEDGMTDAGDPPQFDTVVPDGGPLEARIQVNGANTVCGTCAVLVPEVQGGTPPYSYTWSDSSLVGPGPFQVCPDKPTQYGLTVTDSSGSSAGEITSASQKVKVTASVDCVASAEDAGVTGCRITTTQNDSPDAGTPCPANETATAVGSYFDGGVYNSLALPLHLVGGQPYVFYYDRILPISIGGSVVVDIYGSSSADACTPVEKLFTMHLDGALQNWNQTFCFTPAKDYDTIVVNDSNDGLLFYQTVDLTGTLCTETCPM